MAWKNGEFDFHGVELFAAQGKTTTPPAGGRINGKGKRRCVSVGRGGEGGVGWGWNECCERKEWSVMKKKMFTGKGFAEARA